MRIWQVSLLGLALGIGAAWAQEPEPLGDEFQVNTYTTNRQNWPDVAMAPDGDFVVVWNSWDYPGASYDTWVGAQRYDATGTPMGGEIQVQDSVGCCDGFTQAVAIGADSHFVVVWAEDLGDPSVEIRARLYDELGDPLTNEFSVNTYTTDSQMRPAVAVDPQGDFVVVWMSDGSDGTDTSWGSIQGQRFNASGTPLGGEFQVNSYTTYGQSDPSVAVGNNGGFVVTWESRGSYGTDTDRGSIQGQRYDDSGTPVGGQFQVNSYTTGYQWAHAVATDPQGDFVVVWTSYSSYGTDTSYQSIQGQRFNASGIPVGGEFQVNSYTTGNQVRPAVAVSPLGDFVVVWYGDGSFGTDADSFSIQGQRYDADGLPIGGEFQVNSYTTDYQKFPAVAADGLGKFVVVWRSNGSYGTDTDQGSIQGQRFSTGIIFADGFESGDTSAWSSTVQ